MSVFIIVFLVSLSVTAASTPLIRQLAIRLHFVDAPASRKLHTNPMPLMGGVAIFGGAVLAIIFFVSVYELTAEVVGILLSITVMALLGLVDDRSGGMSAKVKLGGQLVGAIILIGFGVYVRLPIPLVANYLITVLWVVGLSNAVNFLDNMDGLCAGTSAVAAAFITLMAALNGQELVAALAAALLGATLGFLRYNFKPAVIFMGDAGSLFLGFLLAILALELRFPENSTFVTWMVPILLVGVPLFDTSLVTVSRLRRGVNPFTTAGKDHLSHRLVGSGLTQKETVLIIYLLGCVFGMIALFITQADLLEGYVIGGTVAVLGIYAIYRFEWINS